MFAVCGMRNMPLCVVLLSTLKQCFVSGYARYRLHCNVGNMTRIDSTLDAELWSENELTCIHLADKPLSEFGSRDIWIDENPELHLLQLPTPTGTTTLFLATEASNVSQVKDQCRVV